MLSPESGLIEQQNANNELLCLCCLFVITHVSNPKSEDEDKVLLATWWGACCTLWLNYGAEIFSLSKHSFNKEEIDR